MKIEYDSIIESNIANIQEHEKYDSKSTLYRRLGFNYSSFSKDRRNAIDRHIAQYMLIKSTDNCKRKREVVIEKIFDAKQPIEDNRHNNKGGNNNKYGKYSTIILMYYIPHYCVHHEDGSAVATCTKSELRSILLDRALGESLMYEEGEHLGLTIYKTKLSGVLDQAIKTGLNTLKRDGFIDWKYDWVVVSKTQIKDKSFLTVSNTYGYTYEISNDEVSFISDFTERFCNEKGCSIQKVWREYYYEYTSLLSEELEKAYGYDGIFREYIIKINNLNVYNENIPEESEIEESIQKIRELLSNIMYSVVYEKDYKKWSKKTVEQFKNSEPELFELIYYDMEKERATILDDYESAIPAISRLHSQLFDEKI